MSKIKQKPAPASDPQPPATPVPNPKPPVEGEGGDTPPTNPNPTPLPPVPQPSALPPANPPADSQQPRAAPAAPATMFVLDTTATPNVPQRTHEQIVDGAPRSFVFQHAKPLELPTAIALKFLKHEAFKATTDDGTPLGLRPRPRQPDELGAGEEIVLAKDETIARYDELSTTALFTRAAQMPGGEVFAKSTDKPNREAMIAFIVKTTQATKKANTSQAVETGRDEFVPDIGDDD